MLTINTIKSGIAELYRKGEPIHVNVSLSHPKVSLKNDLARIVGVYPYVFRIEEKSSGAAKCHTLQYSDILTGNIEIIELFGK